MAKISLLCNIEHPLLTPSCHVSAKCDESKTDVMTWCFLTYGFFPATVAMDFLFCSIVEPIETLLCSIVIGSWDLPFFSRELVASKRDL
eukprot:scaffold5439_cov132-Cylindrotheca_fusiformis.AAC.8